MNAADIGRIRLKKQGIEGSKFKSPYELVKWLGAVQAQDYLGTLWALGLRIPGSVESDIRQAVAEGKIVRTWPQRGTLHFVAPEEARWRLSLSTPRLMSTVKSRWNQLDLDQNTADKSVDIFRKELAGGKRFTRQQMADALERNGISPKGQRSYHLLWYCAQNGHIIFGPPQEKQQTFMLFDDWVPKAPEISCEEAMARLAKGYFTSHGPATEYDLAFWSGQTLTDIRRAIGAVKSELNEEIVDGKSYWMAGSLDASAPETHLLPGFDEYYMGYKDRTAGLDLKHHPNIVPGSNGMFLSTVVIGGKAEGTWKRELKKDRVVISVIPFGKFTSSQKKSIRIAAENYGRFLGLPVEISY